MALVTLPTRAPRRPTPPSYIVISGENTTIAEAAKKLGMTLDIFSRRRLYVIKQLAPGEKLTWEALRPTR